VIKGLSTLLNKLSQEGVTKLTNKPLKEYIKKVVDNAKSNAPTLVTQIRENHTTYYATNVGSTISGGVKNGIGYLDVGDPEGPYLEFGTGKFAKTLLGTYPIEWRIIASEFYKTGKGITVATPYLYPAIEANEKVLDQELQKMLDKL
jgi:hypothetical protein